MDPKRLACVLNDEAAPIGLSHLEVLCGRADEFLHESVELTRLVPEWRMASFLEHGVSPADDLARHPSADPRRHDAACPIDEEARQPQRTKVWTQVGGGR
jgi:hypothetical protein